MRIGFWGANNTVTGSRTVVETNDARILVDCGLFQGSRSLEHLNREPFAFRPSAIDGVIQLITGQCTGVWCWF
ncbi:MAG: hypothetical protein RLZZ449_922 [Actinomycetota bacterium]